MLPNSTQLIALFEPLSNWQDRYRQIIQLAKLLPEFPEQLRTEENQIVGCENRVWLTCKKIDQQTFIFYGDSEGRIVKGLLTILIILANDKTAEQIIQMDLLAELRKLRIIDELSNSRQLGVSNIITRINTLTQQNR